MWCPDLRSALILGEATHDAGDASIVVGTSAVLYRDFEAGAFDLVIVDELHRWSRAQREKLAQHGTHRLELSATPIPRTQALLRYGAVSQSVLRTTPYPRTLTTRLYEGQADRRRLFEELHNWIRSGERLLIVYPRREAGDETETDRHNVIDGAKRWDAMFPGLVSSLTALDADDVKRERLAAFRDGTIRILVCTTVVEVGLNLPELHRIVIVSPHLLGLMSLHQLRGRVARRGGEGRCDLYAQHRLRADQRRRLLAFMRMMDGHQIADLDLQLRGCGDLGSDSTTQSGADRVVVYGQGPDTALYDAVWPVYARLRSATGTRAS